MKTRHFSTRRLNTLLAVATLLSAAFATPHLTAATIVWSGANAATDTNWSDNLNWIGNVAPQSGDDVRFFDTDAASAVGTVDNIVDGGFGGTIGTLQYGNTNGFHTTFIAAGTTLTITNTGGIYVGTSADLGVAHTNYAMITGANGTLIVSNSNAVISCNQGTAQSVNFAQSILNLTNLGTFNAVVSRIGLGTTTTTNPGAANQREAGSLYLAMTNNITVLYSVPLTTYETLAGATNGIELQRNPGNNAGSTTPTTLYLGLTNVINVDSIGIGRDKSDASCLGRMAFNPAFIANNPVAYFYGVSGPGSRVTWWGIGDANNSASSSHGGYGTNDFSGGTVYAYINVMSLGRDCGPAQTWSGPNKGSLTFTAGTMDVNTLLIGNQSLGSGTSPTTPCLGVVNVNGTGATLKVNTSLVLGNTTANNTAAKSTLGILQVTGGTVLANQISIGSASTATNTITVNNGTLVISNTVGSPAHGVYTFSLSGSTLQLNVLNATTNIVSQNFSTAGSDIINISSAPIFSSYPAVVRLITYSGSIGGSGYSALSLGSIPADLPGAFLSNDTANASVDLVVPNDPVPVITYQPLPFSGAPNSTVTLSVTNTGNMPISYQWYFANATVTNALMDGPGESGSSTLTGSLTNSLTIANAQAGDSGNYFVIITNIYGAATSSVAPVTISANPILPSISRLNNQTNIAGTTATISPAVTGNPYPTLQWQFNGINLTNGPGPNGEIYADTTGTTLSIGNLQYPADQGTYTLIAGNTAGFVTNSMMLTVFVTPGITNQPAGLTVTNSQSASFSVLAGGVPSVSYQWFFNSNPVSASANSSATSATLTISQASPTNTGSYYVQISNAAGTTNSASVTLTVNSTMSALALSPSNAQTGVCYDTPFYITFSSPVVENHTGKIRIYNVTNSTTPVDTIDLSLNAANGTQGRNLFPGDSQAFNYYPVMINGNVAAIYPQAASGIMTSNQTYYVTVDDGAFTDTNGAFFAGISATNAWQFTTKPGGPANPTNLVVAQNDSGDFATVQGAVDSIPLNNASYTLINIQNGNYVEIVDISSKPFVTFRGQSRNGAVVGYPNNANIAPGGTTQARMAFKVNSSSIAVENMTLTNMTAQGGSQAEALMIDSGASHFILNNAEVDSRQDTILANVNTSQGYFYNSLIQGNFDYIWGGGNLFFTNCQIRTITGTTTCNLAAPRTDNGATGNWPGYSGLLVSNGFSFVQCLLTFQSGAGLCSMSDANGEPNGNAAWINCEIDTNCYTNATAAVTSSQLLWDYGCSNINNTVALNNSATPFIGFTQLNNGDPRLLAAENEAVWLNGWTPALAPNIIGEPTNQTVSGGQSASFTVSATGIPDPGYQWLNNGVPISGATGATYTIAAADATNAGNYSVVVTNGSGVVTSLVATLTYVLPVANTATYTRYAGYPLGISITNLLSNVTDASPGAVISLVGTGVSTNGVTLGNSSGFLLYQNPNNVNDQFTYTVTDGYGGTNSGLVNVAINNSSVFGSTAPVISATNGVTSILYSGIAGYSYSVNRATNLLSGWTTIWTTNMPASGVFQFKDLNPPQPDAYYQLLWNWY